MSDFFFRVGGMYVCSLFIHADRPSFSWEVMMIEASVRIYKRKNVRVVNLRMMSRKIRGKDVGGDLKIYCRGLLKK